MPVEQAPKPPSSENQEKDPIVGKELLARLETAVKASLDRCGDAKDDQDLTSLEDESEAPGSEETENQGVEEVGSSSSSSQGEVIVNPTNLDSPKKPATPRPGPSAGYCYQFPSTTAGGSSNNDTQEKERNNNKETTPENKRHTITNRPSHQLLVHHVPVTFPVPGNIMESEESSEFIKNALDSVCEANELPGDIIVNARLLNKMKNTQLRATVIVELDSEESCKQIVKKAKNKIAKDKNFAYYITQRPQRLHPRNISYSDEETQPKKANHQSLGRDKRNQKKPSETPNDGTPKRPREEIEKDGPSKRQKMEPESAGPINAVSTPIPSTSRIDPNTPVDALAELVRGVTSLVPVPRIDPHGHRKGHWTPPI